MCRNRKRSNLSDQRAGNEGKRIEIRCHLNFLSFRVMNIIRNQRIMTMTHITNVSCYGPKSNHNMERCLLELKHFSIIVSDLYSKYCINLISSCGCSIVVVIRFCECEFILSVIRLHRNKQIEIELSQAITQLFSLQCVFLLKRTSQPERNFSLAAYELFKIDCFNWQLSKREIVFDFTAVANES